MIRLNIDTKKCTTELLLRNTFDEFFLIEGTITTFNEFHIDGYLHSDFFEESPERKYSLWREVREYCFSIIKGKRTPLNFKFIFSLSPTAIRKFLLTQDLDFQPENVQGLYLNLLFDGTSLTCITGTSLTLFTLDNSLEHAWDKWVRNFFESHQISNNDAF